MNEENAPPPETTAVPSATPSALPAAPFEEVFKKFLKPSKYFTELDGRARRGEYWTAALMLLLPTVILGFIAGFIAISARSVVLFAVLMLPIAAVGLFMFPVTVRRWHDLGATGWLAVAYQAIVGFPCRAIPILGSILGIVVSITCLVFFCLPGRKGNNAYGADPCDPSAVDPADSRKEPWMPLFLVYVGLMLLNWAWNVYTTKVAIDAINDSFRNFFTM